MDTSLEARVKALEARNDRVDANKAWETSTARKVLIAMLTYVIVTAYGLAIGARDPALNAVVPTAGFLLSTLTIPHAKRWWLRRK